MRINLTKEDSLLLKGMAIVAIIFHNFYHMFKGGILENEFTFHPDSYWDFWDSFLHPGFDVFNNFFSFYGHYGVSVFFFVSGYGLVRKYPPPHTHDSQMTMRAFMTEKIRKFWLLMVPLLLVGIVGLAVKDFYSGEFHDALEYMKATWVHILYKITFTGNFISNEEALWPVGPWWFFSAILQVYLVYWLIINKTSSNLNLSFIAISCVLLQIAVYAIQEDYLLMMMRYNFPAWLPIFIIGVMCGRKSVIKIPLGLACLLCCLCFIVDVNAYSWLAGSIFFFFVFLFLSHHVLGKSILLKSAFIWLGGISAHLFVLNAFPRHLIFWVLPPGEPHAAWIICVAGLLHLAVCILLAVCYKRFLNFITNSGNNYMVKRMLKK